MRRERETHKIEFFAESTSGHEIAGVGSLYQGYSIGIISSGKDPLC